MLGALDLYYGRPIFFVMNRLHRDFFFFGATVTLLAGCCTPAVVTEHGLAMRKTIKRDGHGGLVEDNQKLQVADPIRDRFTVISEPQAGEIYHAEDPPPPSSIRGSPNPRQKRYHIKYNSIMAALSAEPPPKSNSAPTNRPNSGYLRYRIWIPTDASDNIGAWSPWTTSNVPPDVDSKISLSETPLQPRKWQLQVSPSTSTITIEATGVDKKQYTWTGTWMLGAPADAAGRGYIKWKSQ